MVFEFQTAWALALAGGLLGLLVGSFLNVVVHRLPRMLEQQWRAECAEACGHPAPEAPPFNLLTPRSRCPACERPVRWIENIPVLSWLALRRRCAGCGARISLRYPLVELATAGLFALCAVRWGLSPQAAAWGAFAAVLVCLALIDLDTQYLPDDLNFPLLWLGLVVAALGWTVPLRSAVWGAVLGYLALWSIYHLFKLATGKEGMGHGDFKLLAALGAWLGAESLLAVVLLSSVVGAVVGIALLASRRLASRDTPIPFGPYLAGAGLVALVLGPARLPALAPYVFPFGAP